MRRELGFSWRPVCHLTNAEIQYVSTVRLRFNTCRGRLEYEWTSLSTPRAVRYTAIDLVMTAYESRSSSSGDQMAAVAAPAGASGPRYLPLTATATLNILGAMIDGGASCYLGRPCVAPAEASTHDYSNMHDCSYRSSRQRMTNTVPDNTLRVMCVTGWWCIGGLARKWASARYSKVKWRHSNFFKCRPCYSTTDRRIATQIVALTSSMKNYYSYKFGELWSSNPRDHVAHLHGWWIRVG